MHLIDKNKKVLYYTDILTIIKIIKNKYLFKIYDVENDSMVYIFSVITIHTILSNSNVFFWSSKVFFYEQFV